MKKDLPPISQAIKNIFWKAIETIRIVVYSILFLFIFTLYLFWSDEQAKVSNQYSSEEVYEDVLLDVKIKMSEKYEIPVENIRIVRNQKVLSSSYEYLLIEVDANDKEVNTYVINNSDIQNEIDDALDSKEKGIPEETIQEKYNIIEEENREATY